MDPHYVCSAGRKVLWNKKNMPAPQINRSATELHHKGLDIRNTTAKPIAKIQGSDNFNPFELPVSQLLSQGYIWASCSAINRF